MRALLSSLFALIAVACSCDEPSGVDAGMDAGSGDAGLDAGDIPDGASGDAGRLDPCPGPAEPCGAGCVTTTVDPANCGACGVACAAGEVCLSSGCAADCPAGLAECAGTCVDTANDNAHCGVCGASCDPGEGCVGGSCVPAVVLGPPPARCEGAGPPIVVEGGDGPECTDSLARVSFTFGLCACNDIGVPALSSRSIIDAYDSARGPYEPGGGGGGVGANGAVNIASTFDATGDLRSAGAEGLAIRGQTSIGYALHVDGRLRLEDDLTVGEDGYVGGPYEGGGAGDFGGTLHTPDCAVVPASITHAACVAEAIDVAPPCACGAADLVPVGAIVAHYANAANNDNATVGLDPAVFTAPGAPARLDLPCGYYYLDHISASGAITIAAHGRTALFIGGSIDASSPITFWVAPDATLDVFVGGTLRATSLVRVGTPAYPRQTRVWIGGTCGRNAAACENDADCCSGSCNGGACAGDGDGTIEWSVSLDSECDLNGLFYAANGLFESSARLEMYGAVFAGWYHETSETLIHYDRAAIDLGDDCPGGTTPAPDGGVADAGPPETCGSCRDCGNQACIDGACSSCTNDAQCCAPLICNAGTCELPVLF